MRDCVNPTYRLPLATRASSTQPLMDKFARNNSRVRLGVISRSCIADPESVLLGNYITSGQVGYLVIIRRKFTNNAMIRMMVAQDIRRL